MNRRSSLIIFLIALLLLMALVTFPVLGSGVTDGLSQTWPSRTPTPPGPSPTNPPGTEPPPEETPVTTPEPETTPTATQQPPAGPSAGQPAGAPSTESSEGQLEAGPELLELPSSAEIGDCGLPPIAVAKGPVNVRSGPGIDHSAIFEMAFQEERVIVGRAAHAAWWQILLSVQQLGWVSDQAVTVVGYTGAVPITGEDLNQGSEPGWNPTPNPVCSPPSQEEISVSEGQLAAVIQAERPPTDSTPVPTPEPDDGPAGAGAAPNASLLGPVEDASGIGLIWLPVVGGFLIVAGVIALLVQRRRF